MCFATPCAIPELLALKAAPQLEYNASKKLERPSGMFKWALLEKRKWGIDANPFEGFGQSGDNATKRRPFTPDELLTIQDGPENLPAFSFARNPQSTRGCGD